MPQITRVGLIGCGSIAQHAHIPGYLKTQDVQIVAACDPGAKQRKAVAGKVPGIKLYKSHEEMLSAETFDMISVCTPNSFHVTHAIAALQAGANVLLEKPAALNAREIAAIKKAQQKAGTQLMVGFTHRFMRGPQEAKALLEHGVVGRPYMIRVRFAHTGPYPGWAQGPWFYDPQIAGGGALLDMGIHAIDLCLWLVGPVEDVAAQIGTLRKKIQVDDNALIALRFKNKALGYIDVGWTSPAGFNGIEILCDKGCITVDYATGMTVTSGQTTPDHKADAGLKTELVDKAPTTGGWATEIGQIVEAMRAGEDLGIDIDAGGAALAVATAAYTSARTGKRTKVS